MIEKLLNKHTPKSNGCEICDHLEYDKGRYSCAVGVNVEEITAGSWDFENQCARQTTSKEICREGE